MSLWPTSPLPMITSSRLPVIVLLARDPNHGRLQAGYQHEDRAPRAGVPARKNVETLAATPLAPRAGSVARLTVWSTRSLKPTILSAQAARPARGLSPSGPPLGCGCRPGGSGVPGA